VGRIFTGNLQASFVGSLPLSEEKREKIYPKYYLNYASFLPARGKQSCCEEWRVHVAYTGVSGDQALINFNAPIYLPFIPWRLCRVIYENTFMCLSFSFIGLLKYTYY
jgi:hypothetical protein